MSDFNDPTALLALLLGGTQGRKGKDVRDNLSTYSAVTKALGFDPMGGDAEPVQTWVDRPSAVKLQYGNDQNVMDALSDIDSGNASSGDLEQMLIATDPATGKFDITDAARNAGLTVEHAKRIVDAASAYEKERATNAVDQTVFEGKQAQAKTKTGLPAGDINGFEQVPVDKTPVPNLPDILSALPKPHAAQVPTTNNVMDFASHLDLAPNAPRFSTAPPTRGGVQGRPIQPTMSTNRGTVAQKVTAEGGDYTDERANLLAQQVQRRVAERNQYRPSTEQRTPANQAAMDRVTQVLALIGGMRK